MYRVYWSEHEKDGDYRACGRTFGSEQMREALEWMEALRSRQRQGEAVCFVAMASENPDSVGHAGVADPSPDYNWKKRRQ